MMGGDKRRALRDMEHSLDEMGAMDDNDGADLMFIETAKRLTRGMDLPAVNDDTSGIASEIVQLLMDRMKQR